MRQLELYDDPPAADDLVVMATAHWEVHWGGINNLGGLWGQLTKCRAGPLIFYVRENQARDHFNTSGGERQAMKRGEPGSAPQVLEVCCVPGQWDRAAALVRAADRKARPVRRNRTFTAEWAERVLRKRGV